MSRPSPAASDDAASGGLIWTPHGPVLRMEDAVVETVVTHTTRTTTSFAPIPLPRIPVPESIPVPHHLALKDEYPLAAEPTPEDLKYLALNLGGHRVLVQEDGRVMPEDGNIPGETCGPGWTRSLPSTSDHERVGLAGFLANTATTTTTTTTSAKGKERKRPHEFSRPTTSGGRTDDDEEMKPSSSLAGFLRARSPPRKKARASDAALLDRAMMTSPTTSDEMAESSAVVASSAVPQQASLGSGLEMAALFSLPAIVQHFDQLPDKIQQHVLMHLFRRSRMPTIQRISAFASTALKRDFVGSLPHEVAIQILRKVDAKSLATAARVSRKWRKMIDSERSVWRTRLVQQGLWYGHGVEEEEEKRIKSRWEILEWKARHPRVTKAGTPSDDEPMLPLSEPMLQAAEDRPTALKHVYRRRHVSNRNWLHRKPQHTSFAGHGISVVTCVQFDEEKIVSASDDHSINIYCTKTGQLKKRLDGHEGGVWALEYKGDTLVSGSTDRTVRVWDLESLQQTHVFFGHTSTVRCLQIVEPVFDEATGEYQPPYPMVVTGSRDASLRVWKLPKKGEPAYMSLSPTPGTDMHAPPEQNPYHVHHLEGHSEAVRALAVHGRICVSGSYDKTVRVWDIVKGTCIHVLYGHEHKVYSIVYDRFRNRCASGSMDNTVKVWDIATGTCLHTLTGHTSLVGLLGASPSYYVSAAADASLRVWDAETHELKHVLASHAAAITCFQHDETKVVSGSDGTLKLWDIRTGTNVRDLITGISSVWQVAFHGSLLVAASNRGGSTVFDVFDFGADPDPSGIDDERLDTLRRKPWERGNPREPQTYQCDDDDMDRGVLSDSLDLEDAWTADSTGVSPDTAERLRTLDVRTGRDTVPSSQSQRRLRKVHGLREQRTSDESLGAASTSTAVSGPSGRRLYLPLDMASALRGSDHQNSWFDDSKEEEEEIEEQAEADEMASGSGLGSGSGSGFAASASGSGSGEGDDEAMEDLE